MRKRRFAQVAMSDDEEETKVEEEEEEKEQQKKPQIESGHKMEKGSMTVKKNREEEDEEEEEEEEDDGEPKPIGEVIKISGKGRRKKKHYAAFELDGNQYELEDSVLLTPEEKMQKPYVAIIKDITQDIDGNVMVNGQWFYRPEEAPRRGGGNWETHDTRELFYSFHLDEVPAESVMHKCVVHFVPLNKQLPVRIEHPGFIVQKVYDTVERKLWKLTDKDYEDNKQHEIDLYVQKTRKRLGELPDIEIEDSCEDDPLKNKRFIRKKNMLAIDVSRTDDATIRSDQLMKAETPGSCTSDVSEFYSILANYKVLTGDSYRDRWLEKLLQGIQSVCNSMGNISAAEKEKGSSVSGRPTKDCDREVGAVHGSQNQSSNVTVEGKAIHWPDTAVSAIISLEKASHEALGIDFQKYNQKMRQLDFNLKSNVLLASRLLKKELEPSVILIMSPTELKDGLTAEEKTTQEPEQSQRMQMTDARCSRCMERKVGVADVIQAGGSGDRYLLECTSCGHTWYASRDAISSLTIDTPSVAGNVGTAPWATAKFEAVEKKLVSPRDSSSEKPSPEIFWKKTAAYMPVMETQKSFNRSKPEDPSPSAANAN